MSVKDPSRLLQCMLIICRFLLRLYPASFRERFGPALLQSTQDNLKYPLSANPRLRAVFWIEMLLDLLITAGQEHLHQERNVMKSMKSILNAFAIVLLLYWIVMFSWSVLSVLTGIGIPDPLYLLMGDMISNFEMFVFEGSLIFGPPLALLIFFLPLLKIERIGDSDGMLIRVSRPKTATFLLMVMSTLMTVYMFGIRLLRV